MRAQCEEELTLTSRTCIAATCTEMGDLEAGSSPATFQTGLSSLAQLRPACRNVGVSHVRLWRFSDIRRRTGNVGDSSESGRETGLIGLTLYEYAA